MKRTRLINARKNKNLTLEQVSNAIGIKKSHYSKLENGKSNPSWDVGCSLGYFFGIEACKLLQRDGENDDEN